jgi:hypothetical protein
MGGVVSASGIMEVNKMKRKKLNSIRGLQLSTVIILGLVMLAPMVALADRNSNPGVLPVNSTAYGMTYGDWSAEWWKWAFSLPVDNHPLFDTANCGTGQSGKVWFLGASFASTTTPSGEVVAIATRDCTIPTGKALFFPVANVEASTIEGNGVTFEELLANATMFQDSITNLSAEVDGISIQNLNNYRVHSQLFTFGPLPNNNVLQFLGVTAATPGTTSNSVADGVYLMLPPLSVGHHTIHFHAEAPAFNFILDITYHITVAPKPS